jgi:biotin operon repressor
MKDEQIPPEVSRLVQGHIHSIEALEVLVFLYQRRDRAVALSEIADQLRISRASAEAGVNELAAAGLATRDSVAAGYRPTSLDLDQAVAGLVHAYEHFRVETLVLISSNAIHRVRNDALRIFAEAFRLGGKKKDG